MRCGPVWHRRRSFAAKTRGAPGSSTGPCGTIPAGPQWEAGFGGLCLHSIAPWPGEPDRLAVGISAAGIWLTDDRGESWRRGVEGLVPGYLPEEARQDTFMHCIHKIQRPPLQPTTLYMQFHGGGLPLG